MILKKIDLYNFRQYKGLNTITFSSDKDKNVTVILGDNTCGKTTLVQAFIWCFYGKLQFNDTSPLNAEENRLLQNSPVESVKECYVQVKLEHDNTNYLIKRNEKFTKSTIKSITSNSVLEILQEDDNGNFIYVLGENLDNVINNIMPRNLADYFFFWGERIEKLSESKELNAAVKQLLELDTIEAAIDHLKSAIKKLKRENNINSDNSKVVVYQNEIDKLQSENDSFGIKDTDIYRNIEFFEKKINELNEERYSSANTELKERINKYDNIVKELEFLNTKRNSLRNKFDAIFNDDKNYYYYLLSNKANEAIGLLQDYDEPVVGWNTVDANVINEILEKGQCVCGKKFTENDPTFMFLKEQLKIVAPNVLGGVINAFVQNVESKNSLCITYEENLRSTYAEYCDVLDKIDDYEIQKEKLHNSITRREEVLKIEQKLKEYKKKVSEYNIEKGQIQEKINQNYKRIERYQAFIEAQKKLEDKYLQKELEINYAESVLKMFNDEYFEKEKYYKEKLEQNVNNNFSKIYHGKRRIVINDKYNAITENLVGDNWERTETSPGLETVKNFAFIIGLLQCSREKILDGAGSNGERNNYPLVLDAPFSQADEKHIPNVSELIANEADQIILVVMEKDWHFAKDKLIDKVGRFYRLKKKSETCTYVMEGDHD